MNMQSAQAKNSISKKMKTTWRQMINNRKSYAFMVPFMVVFITFTIVPVVTAIWYSFTYFNILETPLFVGLQNYQRLFLGDKLFMTALKNTLVFAAVTGPMSYILCLLLAWFINDLNPKLRAVLTVLFYAPSLANIFFVWQLIFSGDSNGFLNAYLMKIGIILEPIQWLTDTKYIVPVIIFIILWSSLGTSFLTFIAGFQNIDRSLFEAAAVDGIKNRWQELWFITLPYIRPQLMFGAVMSITSSFGIGDAITGLVGYPSTNYVAHTIMHHLNDFGNIRFEMGYACAIAVILFIVMVSANQVVQKMLAKVGE